MSKIYRSFSFNQYKKGPRNQQVIALSKWGISVKRCAIPIKLREARLKMARQKPKCESVLDIQPCLYYEFSLPCTLNDNIYQFLLFYYPA